MEQLPKDRDIVAIVPEYSDQGDSTRLYLRDGTERLLSVTMRTTLRALARRRCKDIGLMRRWAQQYTHHVLNNPLSVGVEMVLAPVKTREPRVEGDEAMGCVNVAAGVAAVRLAGSHPLHRMTELHLAGGRRLSVRWSLATTQRHLKDAELVHTRLVAESAAAMLYQLQLKDKEENSAGQKLF